MRCRNFLTATVCLFFVLATYAQLCGEISYSDSPVFPSGVKGGRIRSAIDAWNGGSPELIHRFLAAQCTEKMRSTVSEDEQVVFALGFLAQTGGVDFSGIRSYVPARADQTVVIVKDRNYENFWALVFSFSDDPDPLIASLVLNQARPPSGLQEPPLTEADVVAQTKALVARLASRGSFSGVMLLAKGDHVLVAMAGGEASKAFHVPNNVDTKFNLGSMNKMFTATAAMRLVEQGKIALDDPLSKFLDETWLPTSVSETITIRQLLSHSSGLGSYFNDAFDRSSRALFRRLDDYKPLIKDEKSAFTPGSRFQYSNTGMFLLGVVIEKVTGQDYFEHIRRVIYEPAGMKSSDCYEMDTPVENLAIGYSPDPKSPSGWRNNLYKHVIKGGPAGGGFSTVLDLHRFAMALLGGKYVSAETLKAMWTDYFGANYGFGFTVSQGPGGRIVGHSGGFDGVHSQLDIYLDSGYIVAVMSNVDLGASSLVRKLNRLLSRI